MSLSKVIYSCLAQVARGTPIWRVSVSTVANVDCSALEMLKRHMFENAESLRILNDVDAMDDPVDRLSSLLSYILNPHMEWPSTIDANVALQPFNPVLGEFISHTAIVPAKVGSDNHAEYAIDIEQISHHPPRFSVRLAGPTFTVTMPNGGDPSGTLKPGFNSLTIEVDNVFQMENSHGIFEWGTPGMRVDSLFTSNRNLGPHGNIWVRDPSGYQFAGHLTKPDTVVGHIISSTGSLVFSVEGSLKTGLYVKKSRTHARKLWMAPVAFEEMEVKTDLEVLSHPKLSKNVWNDVARYMRMKPVNHTLADASKKSVEDAQREEARRLKESGEPFVSRFGFQTPSGVVVNH